MSRCPSRLALEEYLMDPGAAPVTDHVSACPACAKRLEEMRRLSGEFRRVVYPRTAKAILDSVERPSWVAELVRLLTPATFAVAAAACMLLYVGHVRRDDRLDDDYVGTKGGGMSMTVFARTLDGSEPLADGARVRPGTALRFEVRAPAGACHLWLVSIDDLSQVSRLYPASGSAATHAGGVLPGGVILDERTGPERIFAICSREPLDYAVVERAARASGGGGGGGGSVRAAHGLAGLPAGVLQATLLLEKSR